MNIILMLLLIICISVIIGAVAVLVYLAYKQNTSIFNLTVKEYIMSGASSVVLYSVIVLIPLIAHYNQYLSFYEKITN